MIGWTVLALALTPVLCEFNFRLSRNILEVRGLDGNYLPLCLTSARQEYAEYICTSSGSYLASYESVAISSPGSYAIACVGGANCFPYLSNYCKRGVAARCSKDFCPPGSISLGKQCLQISVHASPSFSDAKESCSFRVLSIPRESERTALTHLISTNFDVDKRKIYFTSGYRGGSQWLWEDGTPIDFPVYGQGRCLAIAGGEFRAVECESPGTALCEVARECIYHEEYNGKKNTTKDGLPCMKWNDPSVLYYGGAIAGQATWDHNFCRLLEDEDTPSCFSSPTIRNPCMIPDCPDSSSRLELKADLSSKCGPAFFACRDSGKCLPDDFRCDFEPDCTDASDEEGCEDYLKNFELVGTLKIADKITEIWTYIPHVQGCARRCNESTLVCEAFSYEARTQTCLLTDSSEVSSNLAVKLTSQYYRRKFSTKDVHYELVNSVLRVAKNNTWAHVCDDGFSSVYATSICNIFNYGLALAEDPVRPHRPAVEEAVVAFSSTTSSSYGDGWSVQCIRDASCTTLTTCSPLRLFLLPKKPLKCYRFICSTCSEAVCTDGTCLSRHQLCDGRRDCRDGSDENDCDELSFRLIDGSELSGDVQVSFKGMWQPVCSQYIGQDYANKICSAMNMGTPANVLTPRVLRSLGWQLRCDVRCSLSGFTYCQNSARIRCHSAKPSTFHSCGLRRVQTVARDPLVTRYARVVGGFETASGAFPWTAAIRNKVTGAHHCGASVLDRTHLITAAHCFEEDRRVSSYVVVVGEWDNTINEGHEQILNISRFNFYPLYEDLFAHDLAIIEVAAPGMRFDDWTQPICLPPRDFTYQTGRKCVVSGWGSLGLEYPSRLQAAVLPIIDRAECMNSSRIYASMSRSAFCAGYLYGGVDSCQGDSGGPLACQNRNGPYVLAGVISWGDGCAQKGQPGIYTMVAPYLTWIQGIVKF